jgi:hypothetical protein
MEMMQAFYIGWKPSMYGVDFDLIMAEARLFCLILRYDHWSIWEQAICQSQPLMKSTLPSIHSKRFPRRVYFRTGMLSVNVFFEKRPVESDYLVRKIDLIEKRRCRLHQQSVLPQ